jgi:hypothetical protein
VHACRNARNEATFPQRNRDSDGRYGNVSRVSNSCWTFAEDLPRYHGTAFLRPSFETLSSLASHPNPRRDSQSTVHPSLDLCPQQKDAGEVGRKLDDWSGAPLLQQQPTKISKGSNSYLFLQAGS